MSLDGLLDLFYPPTCVACDEVLPAAGFFCEACAPLVNETGPVHCQRCAEPGRFEHSTCPRCTSQPPTFDRAYAPFEHDGSVATAIRRFKYEGRAELSRALAQLLALRVPANFPPGALCPMPLHVSRYRERGYDQATLLAVDLARATGRAFNDSWLTRERPTTQQVGLSESARESNVRGAFAASPSVRGHAVVLIDDVLTTGATAREAARVLKGAGATEVSVLTLARARRESLS